MIHKTHFTYFRLGELLQFMNDTTSICERNNAMTLSIAEKVNAIRTVTVALERAYKLDQGSKLCNDMISLDQQRDTHLNGIRQCADALTSHFDPNKSSAAKALVISIDKYGQNISRMNCQAETSTIKTITDNWSNDKQLAAAIETLQIGDWTARLKTTNEQFSQVYKSKTEEKSKAPHITTLELRKTTLENYFELTSHIEASATIAPPGTYKDLIHLLNLLIEKYNFLVDTRAQSLRGSLAQPIAAN